MVSTVGDVRDLAFSDYAFAALLEDGHVTTWGLAVCSWTVQKGSMCFFPGKGVLKWSPGENL